MYEKLKSKNGITLVALVITIIILLILSGISIQAITNTGLFAKAEEAKEVTVKAQLKEEIELAIQEIQIEEISKGNSVTLESLAKGQLVNKLTGITATLEMDEIIGEYKNYDYIIDSNLNVEIKGKIGGIKPTGTAEILTSGYIFEGNGTVQIKVTGNITEGTITKIEAPGEATLVTDTSTSEKTYEVSQNGTYVFNIVGDNGRKISVTAKVENILSTPQIVVDEVAADGFKINVNNNYPEGAITEYKYYVGNEIKNQGTTNTSYTVTGLAEDTEYDNIKVVAYISSSISKESNIEKVSTIGAWSEVYQTTGDYTDEYGNVAKIPEGFQVSKKPGQKNINEGLVVRNATDKNEFVWIPVGTIYTDVERTEENAKTIGLNRYTFNSSTGAETAQDDKKILGSNDKNGYNESATSTYGNTTAKDINAFKTSVATNGGYYIGRYEARKNSSGTITEKGTDTVWNFITQPNAATAAKNMYSNDNYISDLVNSYAWDTAIVFLQKCGTNSKYSLKNRVSAYLATTGTNNQSTKDVQCNVYDMASNVYEWTTEAHNSADWGWTFRGGSIHTSTRYTSSRYYVKISLPIYDNYFGFRPILYLSTE